MISGAGTHLGEESTCRVGIGGRELDVFDVLDRLVGRVAHDRDDQGAIAEAERNQFLDVDTLLIDEVPADDAEVSRAHIDITWDIVVPTVEDREGEVAAPGQQPLSVALEFETDQAQ